MAKTHKAAFAQDPLSFGAVLTTSHNINGSDAVELFVAGQEGAIISRLAVMPMGAVTATGVVFYTQKSGSAVRVPRFSVTVPARAHSVSEKLPRTAVSEVTESEPLRLGRGDKLFVGALVVQAAGLAVTGEASQFYDEGAAV